MKSNFIEEKIYLPAPVADASARRARAPARGVRAPARIVCADAQGACASARGLFLVNLIGERILIAIVY